MACGQKRIPQEQRQPLTRDDVVKMIQNNGATAAELDLSKHNLRGINLSGIDLDRAVLSEADFWPRITSDDRDIAPEDPLYVRLLGLWMDNRLPQDARVVPSDLSRCKLRDANLQEAMLPYANLEGAKLISANIRGASLVRADLSDCDLSSSDLRPQLKKNGVDVPSDEDYAQLVAKWCRGELGPDFEAARTDLKEASLWKAHCQGALFVGAILSGANMTLADLREAKFASANLEKAQLIGAHLEKAMLWETILSEAGLFGAFLQGATLSNSDLRRAHLERSNLQGTRLYGARLEGAFLLGAELSPDTFLAGARWGKYLLGEETEESFGAAIITYRMLKSWHQQAGFSQDAGEFYYRELVCRRKALLGASTAEPWPELQEFVPRSHMQSRLKGTFYLIIELLCGYGERPWQVIYSIATVSVVFMVLYASLNLTTLELPFVDRLTFAAYFSATSLFLLGRGDEFWHVLPWAQTLGIIESALGYVLLALLIATLSRRMFR